MNSKNLFNLKRQLDADPENEQVKLQYNTELQRNGLPSLKGLADYFQAYLDICEEYRTDPDSYSSTKRKLRALNEEFKDIVDKKFIRTKVLAEDQIDRAWNSSACW